MRPTFTRRATIADADNLAAKLIGPDRTEVEALTGLPAELCVPAAVGRCVEAYASGFAASPGEVSLLWGADPLPGIPDVGIIWMLSSPDIFDYPQVFAPKVKEGFTQLASKYLVLTNFTLCDNHAHHKLITWLGGVFIRRVEKFGAASLPFYEFAFPCA